MFTSTINCPACGEGKIIIEPHALLQGHGFSCSHCQAKLVINGNSTSKFSQSLKAYEQLNQQLQSRLN